MTFKQWPKVLKLRLGFEFMNNFLYWMFLIYLTPTVIANFGPVFAGTLLFVSKSIAIIGGFLCGGLSDVFGRRVMMIIGSVLRIVQFGLLSVAFSQSEPLIQATLIVISQFVGMFVRIFYDTASRAMVADTIADPEERTHVFTVFYTAANIAVVFGPIVGGLYFQQAKLIVVSLATLISVGFLIAVYFLFPETLPVSQRQKQQSLRHQVSGYRELFQQRVLLAFFGFLLMMSMIGDANFSTITPIYVVESLGEQITQFGIQFAPLAFLMTVNGILCVTLTHPLNRLYHKLQLKPQQILSVSICLSMLAFFCYSVDSSLFGLTLGMVVYTVGEVSGIGLISTFTLAQAGDAHRGKALALTDFIRSIGQAVTPLLLIFQTVVGFQGIFWTLISFGVIALVFVNQAYRFEQRTKMKEVKQV